jgi:hypothetical protein
MSQELQKRETGISTTLQALQKIMPGAMVPTGLEHKVEAIRAADFKTARALMPTTVKKAVIEGVPMSVVSQAAPNLIGYIEHELIILSAMVNVDQRLNIQRHQLPVIAQELYENFKDESMEDISVCFRRSAAGLYNDSSDKLLRLDASVITQWMRKYLDEKYAVVEANLMAEKDNIYQMKRTEKPEINPGRNLLAAMEAVIQGKDPGIDLSKYLTPEELKEVEEARKAGFNPRATDNAKSNAYERYKLEEQEKRKAINEERQAFQTKLNRVASDFYEKKGNYGEIKTFEDDKGFYVLAENQQDAEEIYEIATKQE